MDTALLAPSSFARRTATFVRHFLEMCVSMCVGVALVSALLAAAAASGIRPRDDAPVLAFFGIAALIALPMIGWMHFRGMPWRPIL